MSFSLSSQIILFITLILGLISLILALNCLWRAHRMLATFLKLLIIALLLFTVRQLLAVLGYNSLDVWVILSLYFDLGIGLFIFLAILEFFRMIKKLDGEAFPEKQE